MWHFSYIFDEIFMNRMEDMKRSEACIRKMSFSTDEYILNFFFFLVHFADSLSNQCQVEEVNRK